MIPDRIETRFPPEHRTRRANAAGALIRAVGEAFETLSAIQYDAPWKPRRR